MQDGKHVILCIDDDEDVRLCLKLALESNGYAYAQAPSAEEGIRVYEQSQPDLILVDLMMEEIDAGTSFVRELKARGSTAPVYLLTSVGDEMASMTDYSSLGFDGVLQKPVNNDMLLKLLRSKLG